LKPVSHTVGAYARNATTRRSTAWYAFTCSDGVRVCGCVRACACVRVMVSRGDLPTLDLFMHSSLGLGEPRL
jgi:hypothetical protein